MKIIFFSNQLFDYPLKTNKWHVATRVAERGHQVLFVDPPIRLRKLVKQIFQGRWSLSRLLTGFYYPWLSEDREGGKQRRKKSLLKVFTPVTTTVSESPNLANFNVNRMRKQFPEFFAGDAILWVYNPAMISYLDLVSRQLLIYDCVDDYPSMANYKQLGLSREIAEKEKAIAGKADLVFATTRNLVRKLKKWNKKVHYLGNAGDYGRFAAVARGGREKGSCGEAPILSNIPRPRIGFTGAIDSYKLNLPLLVTIAEDHPNKSLVLVGPTGVADSQPDLRQLKQLDNVYFIGRRPYEQMPSFFAGFDVFIIPYNLNDYTLGGCFPVKFLDALAAGLPTVVTNLPAYEDFSEVAYIADDDKQFSKFIQKALGEDSPERQQARMRIARENSWSSKVEKMLDLINHAKMA
ncbi:MAG: glycosyltransferase [Patescibacteria group bacterium]